MLTRSRFLLLLLIAAGCRSGSVEVPPAAPFDAGLEWDGGTTVLDGGCSPSAETCDGLDSDCSGVPDDGPLPDIECAHEHGAGFICLQGACACPDVCGGTCADTSFDPENCGGCGQACPRGGFCGAGTCYCLSGQEQCDDLCTFLDEDPQNCGGCGNRCLAQQSCVDGNCLCTEGTILCDGRCVDHQTDVNNCRVCGTTCLACTNGHCLNPFPAEAIYLDEYQLFEDDLYFTHQYPGTIYRLPKAGGGVSTLAVAPAWARNLAVDRNGAYWIQGESPYALMTVPLAGGTPQTLASVTRFARDINAVDDMLYFNQNLSIMSVPTSGGVPVTLGTASGGLYSLTANASDIYWAQFGYVVGSLSTSGGTVSTVASEQVHPEGVAVDDTNLYWYVLGLAGNGEGKIVKSPLSGGVSVTLATQQSYVLSIATDGRFVYWTNRGVLIGSDVLDGTGTVMRVPVSGGDIETIAVEQDYPVDVAVDDEHVYWRVDSGRLFRAAK